MCQGNGDEHSENIARNDNTTIHEKKKLVMFCQFYRGDHDLTICRSILTRRDGDVMTPVRLYQCRLIYYVISP